MALSAKKHRSIVIPIITSNIKFMIFIVLPMSVEVPDILLTVASGTALVKAPMISLVKTRLEGSFS